MTLKEKFEKEGFSNCDYLEQVAEEFAIEVLEHYHNGIFFISLKKGEAKKILEYIKQINYYDGKTIKSSKNFKDLKILLSTRLQQRISK